jgi:hypothetical protein
MGFARARLSGVTVNSSSKTYSGYTLFTPIGDKWALLIDMEGLIIHQWKMPHPPGLDAELLYNGNLLYAAHLSGGPLASLTGAGGEILEVNWDGELMWRYKDPYLHHTFCRMENGNTMVIKWVKVPQEIAMKVKGGIPGSEREGVMWTDSFQEISPDGKIVWEWLSYEHLEPELDIICPLCSREEWTGANACEVLPDGNILTSFMKTNTIAIIDRDTGAIKWRWGPGEAGHPHHPTLLKNGNILLLDNGRHCTGLSIGYSRLLEVNPRTDKMEWDYMGTPWCSFFSSIMGSCQPLPDPYDPYGPKGRSLGNILVCEATTGRIFEITHNGEIVWEYVSPFCHETAHFGRTNMMFRAYRYGPEYEGLKGKHVAPSKFEQVVQEEAETVEEKKARVKSRLEALGY